MQDTSTNPLTKAKSLIESGFAVYPCFGTTTKNEAKKKAAMMPKGSAFYGKGVPYEVIESEFYKQGVWIGVLCGAPSGNLECLDFDNKFGDAQVLYEQFMSIPDVQDIVNEYNLFIEKTTSGGYHICYKTTEKLTQVDGGGKIARRLKQETNEVIALIETRTEGQYFVTAPSEGYEVILNSLDTIVPFPMEQRTFLIEMAKSMDEYLDEKTLYAPQHTKSRIPTSERNALRAGDDYSQSAVGLQEMVAMLEAEGWKNVYENKWCRPNKTDGGISATLGHVAPNIFYVFSSNAAPFDQGKCYTPFSMLALLHYGGDFSACAKALAERGFGTKFEKKETASQKDANKGISLIKEVLKRVNSLKDVTEQDYEVIAQKTGLRSDKIEELFKEVAEANPYLIRFDFLMPFEKLHAFVNHHYDIKRNTLTKMLTIVDKFKGNEVNEHDVYITVSNSKIKVKKDDLNSLLSSSYIKEHNPIAEYFTKLPSWKESDPDYIGMYASYFKCKDPSHQEFFVSMFRKHLVRSIYCSINGIENRFVFVLLGEQNDGKSTYIRKLCFDENYYTQKDITDGNARDIQIAMFENFMWGIEEIDAYSPQQMNKLKSHISTGYDKTRDLYAKKAELRWRVVNYWASGNKDEILTDETGNSRFLVFRGKITSHDYNNHFTGVIKVPIEMLWAQAFYLYQRGRDFYNPELSEEEIAMRDSINISYEVSNDVEGHLKDLFEPGVKGGELWTSAKIVRYLNRRKINASTKQVNYAIEKLIRKGVWKDIEHNQTSVGKSFLICPRRSADHDFDAMPIGAPPMAYGGGKEDDLPF